MQILFVIFGVEVLSGISHYKLLRNKKTLFFIVKRNLFLFFIYCSQIEQFSTLLQHLLNSETWNMI